MESAEKRKIRLDQVLSEKLGQNGLRLSMMSKKLAMNKSTLHGWMNGVVPRSLTQLIGLAEILGLSLDELCFGESESKASENTIVSQQGFTIKIHVEPLE